MYTSEMVRAWQGQHDDRHRCAKRTMNEDQSARRFLVILAAHGEAESAGFSEQFAVSWRTLVHAAEVMPLPAPLRAAICALGALRKRLMRTAGSRHNAITRRQASALEAALDGDPATRYEVLPAFASAEPGVDTVLAAAPHDATVLLMSMIPTDSRLACGLFCRAAAVLHPRTQTVKPHARLWESADLVGVHRRHIAGWLQENEGALPAEERSALVIVLHGTLLADKSGRPPAFHNGMREKTHYGDALRKSLTELPDLHDSPWQRVEIAYLNHAVGGHWSQPTLEDCLARLAQEGMRCVYAYPAEHLVESAETARMAKTLDASPLARGFCLPSLNDSPRFIDFLADRVRAAAAEDGAWACDYCSLTARVQHL